jgi:cyclophilin family peptidyl-prolyl cis-trans isomerase
VRIWRKTTLTLVLALLAGCGGGEESPGGEQMAAGQPPLPPDMGSDAPRVVLETNVGQIVLELDRNAAPKTVENILYHVENNYYDGLIFHRVIPGFMIQGGGFTAEMGQRQSPNPELMNEADNGLKNVRGSLAMARRGDPHSASTQFFINLVDNPGLDFTSTASPRAWGYAVFGRVIEGMDVVDAIAAAPTQTLGGYADVPVEMVIIERAYVPE